MRKRARMFGQHGRRENDRAARVCLGTLVHSTTQPDHTLAPPFTTACFRGAHDPAGLSFRACWNICSACRWGAAGGPGAGQRGTHRKRRLISAMGVC